jgi:hypothetical protein
MKITRITKDNEKMFLPLLPAKGGKAADDLIRLGVTGDKDKVAGAICARIVEGQADITSLYVLPESRGKGAGKLLLTSLEEILKGQGPDALSAEFFGDETSKGFYGAMGYSIFDVGWRYSFTLGELLRSPLYIRYIKDKPYKNVSFVSALDTKSLKTLERSIGAAEYDPEWSTAGFADGKYTNCMMAMKLDRTISISWLNTNGTDPLILLQHFRALAEKTLAEYQGDMGVRYIMTFEKAAVASKLAKLLGGNRHLHKDGRLVRAIKVMV